MHGRTSGRCDCMGMAGEEASQGSRTRTHINLNLYVGIPPLPQPRVSLNTSAASPTLIPNSIGAALEALRIGEPEESLIPAEAYLMSNVLSAPGVRQMLYPIVYSWLDGSSAGGEEYTHAPQPPAATRPNVFGLQLLGFEGDGLLIARSMRPSRVAAATRMAMVNTSTLGQSTQGAVAPTIEAGATVLRFLSQHHNIVRLGSANRSQGAASTNVDSLVRTIQHTKSPFEAARGQNPDGVDNSNFECNICLEVARQPVVTSCGHLFCWTCLYQWLRAHSSYFECPVCKGEVLKGDITPIYGRGREEGESTAYPDLPPRPQARRRDNLRQLLEMAQTVEDEREMAREMVRVLRQMRQDQIQGWDATTARVETTLVPAARRRAGTRRQQRQDNNAAQVVLATPRPPTSSTAAAIVDEPSPSRRSRRPLESPTIRRTRRRLIYS